MKREHRDLISKNIKLVYSMINRKFKHEKSRKHVMDELYSKAFERLCDKIEEYDDKFEFYNFLYNFVLADVVNYYHRTILKNNFSEVRYDESSDSDDGFTYTWDISVNDNLDLDYEEDFINTRDQYLWECVSNLGEDGKYFITEVYRNGRFINDVSRELEMKSTYSKHRMLLDQLNKKMKTFAKYNRNINTLPNNERVIIKKKFYGGKTLEDISLEMPDVDVASTYITGMQRLNERFKRDLG